jgi:glucose-1-phosphate thymidylyltransferase
MKVLILGAKGMLGQALAKKFHKEELHLWDREELDITDFDFSRYKISELQPELIINAAGYTNVDGAEENFDLAKRINGDAPINLARIAEDINATFVHYSTDYVFDGIKEDGYNENDEPNPISRYGESKAFGEAVLAYCEKCYLVRTSRLFGFSGDGKKSFVEKMLELGEKKDFLELVDEEIGNPTYADDLAQQTVFLVTQEYPYGIYHITNEGECTWYDFAKEIFSISGSNIKLGAVSGDKFPRLAKRPLNSTLINEKLPRLRPWQDAVRDFIGKLRQSKSTKPSIIATSREIKKIETATVVVESIAEEKNEAHEMKNNDTSIIEEKIITMEEDILLHDKKTEEKKNLAPIEIKKTEEPIVNNIFRNKVVMDTPSEPQRFEPRSFVARPKPFQKNEFEKKENPVVAEKVEPVKIAIEPVVEKTQPIEPVKIINRKKNMKGIILSGGKGTRLYPLTKITSKQLLPVYNKPMIMYPLETLINAGIKEILLIVAPEYAGHYLNLLGSGKEFGVKITYEIQDEPRGLPEAFIIGEKFIDDDNVTLILGDNIFFDHDFSHDINSFEKGGRIFALHVPDPERFGVVEFDENRRVVSIEEKPTKPKSNYAVPGIYIFDSRVCNIAKNVKPTWRPETDITEVFKGYLAMGELDVRMVSGRWLDAGTFDSLLKASNWMATKDYEKKMGYDQNLLNKK